MKVVHVYPDPDRIKHELTDDCPCSPAREPVEHEDGTAGWLVTHQSLDA